jgi:chromosome segregation ATPase
MNPTEIEQALKTLAEVQPQLDDIEEDYKARVVDLGYLEAEIDELEEEIKQLTAKIQEAKTLLAEAEKPKPKQLSMFDDS